MIEDITLMNIKLDCIDVWGIGMIFLAYDVLLAGYNEECVIM